MSSLSRNKKGFELSINFVVTIVIALAVLGLGIVLLRNFVGGTIDLQETLDAETDSQLENLLDSGTPVAVPLNRAEVRRGDNHIFGIGVRNTEVFSSFLIDISLSAAVGANNEDYSGEVDLGEWIRYDSSPFSLQPNEKHKISLRVNPPNDALKGTYVFSIRVQRDGTSYGSIQKVWVTIP